MPVLSPAPKRVPAPDARAVRSTGGGSTLAATTRPDTSHSAKHASRVLGASASRVQWTREYVPESDAVVGVEPYVLPQAVILLDAAATDAAPVLRAVCGAWEEVEAAAQAERERYYAGTMNGTWRAIRAAEEAAAAVLEDLGSKCAGPQAVRLPAFGRLDVPAEALACSTMEEDAPSVSASASVRSTSPSGVAVAVASDSGSETVLGAAHATSPRAPPVTAPYLIEPAVPHTGRPLYGPTSGIARLRAEWHAGVTGDPTMYAAVSAGPLWRLGADTLPAQLGPATLGSGGNSAAGADSLELTKLSSRTPLWPDRTFPLPVGRMGSSATRAMAAAAALDDGIATERTHRAALLAVLRQRIGT